MTVGCDCCQLLFVVCWCVLFVVCCCVLLVVAAVDVCVCVCVSVFMFVVGLVAVLGSCCVLVYV